LNLDCFDQIVKTEHYRHFVPLIKSLKSRCYMLNEFLKVQYMNILSEWHKDLRIKCVDNVL